MSNTIDERVVSMKFDNKEFEENVKITLRTLQELQKGLELKGASEGINSVENAARGFSLSGMEGPIDVIMTKFDALGAIGFTVLQNLTNSAIDTGKKLGAALINPIVEGGKTRALNIEQAKFQFKGLGMDVEKTMADASYAVDGTAYSLDVAAKVASQFGASGMRAGEDMRRSLRAISGVAAMAGSSYEDIGNVFTKVAGQGRVMGDDLLRLSSRGINAAATIGKAMNKSEKEVREMVTKGKIDFQTFADAMDEAFGEHATAANETFTGSLANVRAALARIGADVATPALENLKNVFNALRPVVNDTHAALEPVLDVIEQLIIKVSNFAVAKLEGIDMSAATKSLQSFIKAFTAGGETIDKLKRTFAGIIAVIDIFRQTVSFLVSGLFSVLGVAKPLGDGLLTVSANMGDFLVSLNESIKSSGFFKSALDAVKGALSILSSVLSGVVKVMKSFFSGLRDDKEVENFANRTSLVQVIFNKLADMFGKVGPVFMKIGDVIAGVFDKISDGIAGAMNGFSADGFMKVINGGLLAALLVGIKNFMKQTKNLVKDVGGVVDAFSGIFDGVRGSIEAYQKNIKAGTLLKIAGAMMLLATAILIISQIDAKKLATSLGALTAMFAQLFGAMAIFETAMKGDFVGITKVTGAMVLLSAALLILSKALKNISEIPFTSLVKSLGAMTIVITEFIVVAKLLEGNKGFVRGATSLVVLSAALLVLSKAMQSMAKMNLKEIGTGLVGISGGLLIFVGAMKLMPKNIAQPAVGITILSAALLILSKAVESFGGLKWLEMAKGLSAVAGSLLIIAGAMRIMPKGLAAKATGLVILGSALLIISKAIKTMSGMSWTEIAKGLGTIAGALIIFAAGMKAMQTALPGALAMTIMAGALMLLIPSIVLLGSLDLQTIGTALMALAGIFVVLGLAGLALGPVVPILLGLAGSIALLGVGVLAAGAGVTMLAAGLTALGVSAGVVAVGLTAIVTSLLNLIPLVFKKIGEGIIELAGVITDGMPAIVDALTAILDGLVQVIAKTMPKVITTFLKGIMDLLNKLVKYVPKFTQAGLKILTGFLKGIRDNIRQVVNVAVQVAAEFIRGIGDSLGDIVDAGFKLIIDFMNAMADGVEQYAPLLGKAAGNLGVQLIKGLINGLGALGGELLAAAKRVAQSVIDKIKETFGIASPSKVMKDIGYNLMESLANAIKTTGILPVETIKSVGEQMKSVLEEVFGIEVLSGIRKTFSDINKEIIASMRDVVSEAKLAAKATAQEWKNYKKQQKIENKRAALQKKVDKAKDGSKAQKKAQKALDAYNKKIERKEKAAEKKALKKAKKKAADEKKAAISAQKRLNAYMKETVKPLQDYMAKLNDEQERLTEELEAAKEAAAAAQQEMEAYKESVKNAFSTLAKVTSVQAARTAGQYLDGLSDAYEKALEFEQDILKLVELGVDQSIIDDIIAQGVDAGSSTVKYLLDGADEETIAAINEMSKNIESVGDRLGDNLSNKYYQAGVDAANGLVKGLESQLESLNKAMTALAKELTKAIEKALKIKSPSKVLKDIGVYTVEGLILGLEVMHKALADTATDTADIFKETLREGLSEVKSIMEDENSSPVIRPVMDLSEVRAGYGELDRLMSQDAIRAAQEANYNRIIPEHEAPPLQDTGTDGPVVNQYFQDREATPVEVYNAAKFGARVK